MFRRLAYFSTLRILTLTMIFDVIEYVIIYISSKINTLYTIFKIYYLALKYVMLEFIQDGRGMTILLKLFGYRITPSELRRFYMSHWRRHVTGHKKKSCAVITGADGTIGSALMKILVDIGFLVICVGRRPPLDVRATFVPCDLSDKKSVQQAIERIHHLTARVDVFISAAGVMFLSRKDRKNNTHFMINVESNLMLYQGLRFLLFKSHWETPTVIFLSSCCSRVGWLTDNALNTMPSANSNYEAYANSKLYLNAHVRKIADSLPEEEKRFRIRTVHPGIVSGGLYNNVYWPIRFLINVVLASFLRDPETAAFRVLEVAFRKSTENGCYFEHYLKPLLNQIPDFRQSPPHQYALPPRGVEIENVRALWKNLPQTNNEHPTAMGNRFWLAWVAWRNYMLPSAM